MEGKIIGTCGHEITDLENSTIIVKEQGVDYDGFYNAISYLSVCPKCIKNYEDIILHNQKEIDEWLNSSPCVPVPETELLLTEFARLQRKYELSYVQVVNFQKEIIDHCLPLIRSQVYKEIGGALEKRLHRNISGGFTAYVSDKEIDSLKAGEGLAEIE